MICPTITTQSPTIQIECEQQQQQQCNKPRSSKTSSRSVPEDHSYNVKQVNFLIDVGVYHFDRECYELAETSFRLALTKIGISNVPQQHDEEGIPSCQELFTSKKATDQLQFDEDDMQVYRGGLQLCPSDDIKSIPATICYNVGQTYIARGQFGIARKWFECALARSQNTGCIGLEVWILHNIGNCVDSMTRLTVNSNKLVNQCYSMSPNE